MYKPYSNEAQFARNRSISHHLSIEKLHFKTKKKIFLFCTLICSTLPLFFHAWKVFGGNCASFSETIARKKRKKWKKHTMCNFCECQSLWMNMTLPQYRRYFRMLSIRMRMRHIFEGTNHWIAWIRFRAITYTDYCSFLVFFSLLFSSRLSVYCYYYSKCVYISRLFTACLFIYLFCCNFLCVLCCVRSVGCLFAFPPRYAVCIGRETTARKKGNSQIIYSQ